MANLSILNGQRSGETYELVSPQVQLGRDSFCDVVIPTRSVSRQHARIVCEADGFYIEDLNSLNGTYINGRRISRRTRLADRDQIRLFDVLLEFHSGAVPPGAAAKFRRQSADVGEETLTAPRPTTIVNSFDARDESRLDVGAQIKLRAVLEIARNLGQSLAVDEFLKSILDTLFQIFPQADRGYILLADETDGRLAPRAVKLGRGEGNESLTLGPISQSVAQRVMTEGKAILSTDAQSADRAASVLEEAASSMISAPLMGPSHQPLGLIHIDTSDPIRQFGDEDLDVLASVAVVAGHAVEHARLHETAMKLDRRERELAMAQDVQLHFLPQQAPALPGYRFYSYYRAAENVGGDYFGYIPLPDGRLAIAVADVSGKSISAALLMARLCAEVRYCLAVTQTPVEAIARLNREFSGPALGDMFITFLMGVLDPKEQMLTLVNAGHMPPLLRHRRSGAVEPLGVAESGPPLGYDPNQVYAASSVVLEPEDVIVMYTDGISEATNPKGTFYGTKGIERLLARGARDVETLGRQLMGDVEQFTCGSPQSDDICLLCFTREAGKFAPS
ncbi:MAG TPA: SpoIIE family protein phosphatase [Pirellulales bacterium]|jgi:serine phosphatase RsbU (regulator of sigma subunit)/pSer/pThr/pTyr-binding forkhead associated (FHA) protein|nr:SpoIIE family protein phosphatase [Pirellulales bacterium]